MLLDVSDSGELNLVGERALGGACCGQLEQIDMCWPLAFLTGWIHGAGPLQSPCMLLLVLVRVGLCNILVKRQKLAKDLSVSTSFACQNCLLRLASLAKKLSAERLTSLA